MSVKKYFDYAGLQYYDSKWKMKFQEIVMTDDDVDDLWDDAFPYYWSITIDTEAVISNNTITGIPFNLYNQSDIILTVDWGDGNISTLTKNNYMCINCIEASMHEYETPGEYTISIHSNNWKNTYLCAIEGSEDGFSLLMDDYRHLGFEAIYYWRKTLVSVNNSIPKVKGISLYDYNDDGILRNEENSLENLFCECTALNSIPSNLLINVNRFENLSCLFYACSALTSISSELFAENASLTDLWCCFSECTSLASIPSGLFNGCTEITDLSWCFYGCTSLASIPSGLFNGCTEITDLSWCFHNCTSINDFTIHLDANYVSECTRFVTSKANTTRIVYVPDGSTTQTKFNAVASSLGLTIIGE